MIAKDLYTITGELQFVNGDIKIMDNANYNLAECLYFSSKGEFKKSPTVGLNIRKYINSSVTNISFQNLKNEIRSELKNDGFSINDLLITYNQKIKDYEIKTNCDRLR